jgi:hypothetical protein
MKTTLRKLAALNKVSLFRNLAFSVLFLSFFVLVLYVLINSPA